MRLLDNVSIECNFCGEHGAATAQVEATLDVEGLDPVQSLICICPECAVKHLPRLMLEALGDDSVPDMLDSWRAADAEFRKLLSERVDKQIREDNELPYYGQPIDMEGAN